MIYPSQQRALDRIAAGAFVVRDRIGVSLDLDDGTSHWLTPKEWEAIHPLIPREDRPRMADVEATGRSEVARHSVEGPAPSSALSAFMAAAERRVG